MHNNPTIDEQEWTLRNLIIRYGKLVEVKIRAAKTRERAAKFAEDTCHAFDHQCKNKFIRFRFKSYVLSVFEKYWSKHEKQNLR